MKYVLLLTLSLGSCNTERQIQMQIGRYDVKNHKVFFVPETPWTEVVSDSNFSMRTMRFRNTSVRKSH